MADTDNTNAQDNTTDDQQKPGIAAPLAAGAVGAYGGGQIASAFTPKKEEVKTQRIAAEKKELDLETKYKEEEKKLQKNADGTEKPEYTKYREAKADLEGKQSALNSKVSTKWEEAFGQATPAEKVDLKIGQLEGQKKALAKITGDEAVEAQKGVEAQLTKLKELKADIAKVKDKPEEIAKLFGEKYQPALEEFDKAVAGKQLAIGEKSAGELANEVLKTPEAAEGYAKAAKGATTEAVKKAAESIAEATKDDKKLVEDAQTAFKGAEGPWKKITEVIKTQEGEWKTAAKETRNLKAMEEIVSREGKMAWAKKPFSLVMKETSMGRKFGVVGGAVALGAAAYAGVRSMQANKAADSYTDRVDNSRTPDAAAATPARS